MSNYHDWRSLISGLVGSRSWAYHPVNQSEAGEISQKSSSRWRFAKIAVGIALLWIIALAIATPYKEEILDLVFFNTTKPSYFHVLLPANEGNADLCKTLFSAAALDYPTPRMINWGEDYKDLDVAYGGAHIAKIEGILGFLRQLGLQSDNEMVLVADGYDTIFQLRPSVMLDRYHAINDRANRRIASRMGYRAMNASEVPIHQSIVFAAQKSCHPATEDDPECYAVPESDLPTDVYGPLTDRLSGDEETAFSKYRQRYLNSGTIMGPVGDMKRVFEAALVRAKEMPVDTGSEQAAFAALFGAQEYQREAIRERYLTGWKKFSKRDARDSILAEHPSHKRPELTDNTAAHEYGIGLDYRGELSLPTVFAENDAIFLTYSSASSIREAAQKAGVPAPDPPRVLHLDEDIKRSTPPFWTADYTGQTFVPEDKEWSDVPLFTNIWTGISPATIVHPTSHSHLPKGQRPQKSQIRMNWRDLYFFPYLRQILETKAKAYRMPTAYSRGQEWWGPIDERGGFRIEMGQMPGHWLDWDSDRVCGTREISEEVLGDRRGNWVNPVWYLPWGGENEGLERWVKQEQGKDEPQE
jgi:hypothetical protein